MFGIWLSSFLGKDKLAENLDPKTTIVRTSQKTNHEEETYGETYTGISEELRQNAITNPSISMAANAYEKGVFGSGLSAQSDNEDDSINEKVEDIIKLFCKAKNFEYQRRFHFNYWIRFMSKDIIREGGILIRKHRATPEQAKQRKWEIPYKIEMLEISSIDFYKNDKKKNIYNGVQVDKYNAPTRLWFKGGKSVSFSELIMYSAITRITQYHGVSSIFPSLPSLKRQEKHATAEVDNATENAKVSDVYKAKIADTLKLEAQGDYDADLASATKAPTREISDKLPEKSAKIIDTDEEYTRLDRGSYTSAFDSLTKFTNTQTAAGVGLTLDEYTQDLSELTFHGGQVAEIKNNETYSIVRDDLVELVIDNFMIDMLSWCYITGYSDITPSEIKLNYIKTPRKSAQPMKDANAWKSNVKEKFMTPGDVVKQISGENIRDFEKRRLKEELLIITTDEIILKKKKKAGLLEKIQEPKEKIDEK